ncbi:MAG TPA: toll/interleukin-1 receptor domain-containing protein [Chitinispirillaceae bacterium]|nr:toll/interleukin-1 receptor domain-containing protein [Chitinispirillaceae bacterium]
MAKPLSVFISYSHKDKIFCSDLREYLTLLEKDGLISLWYDGQIVPGTEWDIEIKENLRKADIILLLVSNDFINSNYIDKIELKEAMDRHNNKSARVIPIITRTCEWERLLLHKLSVLPKNENDSVEPIFKWSQPDDAYVNIAKGVRRAVEDLMLSLKMDEKINKPESGQKTLTPPDENLYHLFGLKGIRTGDVTIQDFAISRVGMGEKNINAVQYLWADTFTGCKINAVIKKDRIPCLRVEFDHRGGWGCNLAIRPKCEMAYHNKGYRYLVFDAILPKDMETESNDLLKEVSVAVRIVNGRLQHWEYSVHSREYINLIVKESTWGLEPVKIDLMSDNWHLFTSDGNIKTYDDDPNFSTITSVILKFGSTPDVTGEPARGKGIIEIRSLYLSD